MNPTPPDPPPEPGADLLAGRYRLGEPIGQGRSTVYRAEDVRLRRPVAVKEVQLFVAGPEDVERTRSRAIREAHAAARIGNPRAVTVFDVVEERGSIWLVMELIDAPSLAELVAEQGPMEHHRAAQVGLDVLHALDAAHTVGVVHRDVKPANVLVTPRDGAKLTDFGVARIRDDTQVTATGLIIGSPAYMAPEQAKGDRAGPAADLWSLGATLYFAVEGESPFPGTSAIAVATAVVYGAHRPPAHHGPLTAVIERLLSKEPIDRPTPGEVRRALVAAAGQGSGAGAPEATAILPRGVGPSARPGSPPVPPAGPEPARRGGRRRRAGRPQRGSGPQPASTAPAGAVPGPAAAVPGPAGAVPGPAAASAAAGSAAGASAVGGAAAAGGAGVAAGAADDSNRTDVYPASLVSPPTRGATAPSGRAVDPAPTGAAAAHVADPAAEAGADAVPARAEVADAQVTDREGGTDPVYARTGASGPIEDASREPLADRVAATDAEPATTDLDASAAGTEGSGVPAAARARGVERVDPLVEPPAPDERDAVEAPDDTPPGGRAGEQGRTSRPGAGRRSGAAAGSGVSLVGAARAPEGWAPEEGVTIIPPVGPDAAPANAPATAPAARTDAQAPTKAAPTVGAERVGPAEPAATGPVGRASPDPVLDEPAPAGPAPTIPGPATGAGTGPAAGGTAGGVAAGAIAGGAGAAALAAKRASSGPAASTPVATPAGTEAPAPATGGRPTVGRPTVGRPTVRRSTVARPTGAPPVGRGAAGGGPVRGRPGGPTEGPRRPPRKALLVLAAVVLAVLGVAALAWMSNTADNGPGEGAVDDTPNSTGADAGTQGGTGTEGGAGADGTGATATTADRATSPPTAPGTTTSAPTTTTTGEGTVPDGWTRFDDPEGAYRIAVPPGWNAAPGSRDHTVYIRQPGTGTYLLVEWTPNPQPDPVADWRNQAEYFASRHSGYEELRIEQYTYRDYNAAMWEFRFQDGGTQLHTANLGFVAAGRGYALYFQTHEEDWASSQQTYAQFREAFSPAR
ncbi:MAG TPA: protein kinase [Acidimicrobiales bacterium]|nr:protein kinase [Acidimicrobiales bacterium]